MYENNSYSIVISTCCIPVYFPKSQIQLNFKARENLLFFQLSLMLLQHITCSFWISDHVYVSIAQCYTELNLQVLIKRIVLDCLWKKTFIKVNKTAGDSTILTKSLTWWNFSRWGRSSCFVHCEPWDWVAVAFSYSSSRQSANILTSLWCCLTSTTEPWPIWWRTLSTCWKGLNNQQTHN